VFQYCENSLHNTNERSFIQKIYYMKKIISCFFACLLALLFFAFDSNVQAQDCAANYEKALQAYNYGMADSALNILKPCLEHPKAMNDVSKETCANIYRLAALSSIMTGNSANADEYITQLLKYAPDYKNNIMDDDLEEFRMILNNKSAQPDLRLGIRAGTNIPFLKLNKYYSDYNAQESYYGLESKFSYQFGIEVEKTLTKRFSLEAGAGFTQILFRYNTMNTIEGPNEYDESIAYLEIPVLAKYKFNTRGSFQPYLQGGICGKFSLNDISKSEDFGKNWYTKATDSEYILATFLTDVENIGLVLGGGVEYNLKNSSIRLDLRYIHNFKSSGRESKFDEITGYDDIPSTEDFSYTNDINLINLKNLQISLGYFYNLKYRVF
jgi:opacity protein-like surface antigen